MKKIRTIIMAMTLVIALFTACESSEEVQKDVEKVDGKVQVVTSIYPQADFARKIGGDKVEVKMLLKPGVETHSYEPSPKDIELIKNADIFICNGSENEYWVSRVFESMEGNKPEVIELIDCVDCVEEEIVEGMEHKHEHGEHGADTHEEHEHDEHGADTHEEHEHDEHDADKHEEHEHSEHDMDKHEIDEHVWTSPQNAIKIVKVITDKIVEKDEKNAREYEANAKAYIAELEKLDKDFKEVVESAKRKTILFADRFPFRYLADDYGLTYYAAFTGCSNETQADPSTIVFLENKVEEERLPVVFTIEMANGKMAEAICEDTGAEKLILHSCHNLTKDEADRGEDYLSIMRKNLENLKKALN